MCLSSSYHLNISGTSTTVISGNTYIGDWLQIQLPIPIILTKYNIYTRSNDLVRGLKTFILVVQMMVLHGLMLIHKQIQHLVNHQIIFHIVIIE